MRHFKLPLIVTGITLAAALVIGVVGATLIHRAKISDRQKTERSKDLGTATAFGVLFIICCYLMDQIERGG